MSITILLLLALGLGLAGWLAARSRAWAFRRESGAGTLAALVMVWVTLAFHLYGFSMVY